MPERSQEVLVRGGRLAFRSSRHGGQGSPLALASGPDAFEGGFRPSDGSPGWYDDVLAEGGVLLDFDRQRLLAFSWDDDLLRTLWPQIEAAWPGWTVEEAPAGTSDFLRYLSGIGLSVPDAPPPDASP